LEQCLGPTLQEAFEKLPQAWRTPLVFLRRRLVSNIVEELEDKMEFHGELPYSCISIYQGELPGGSHESARARAGSIITEHDGLVRQGKGPLVHRVAHLLLSKDKECRRQLDLFVEHGGTLRAYPVAFIWIQRYALVPLVGRRVEAVHAQIKRLGHHATNVSPSWISAKLTEQQNLDMLSSCLPFYQFCVQRWHSTNICDQLLRLIMPKEELRSCSHAEKLRRVYQCSIASEFRDMTIAREVSTQWLVQTAHTRRAGPRKMPEPWRLVVSYLKAKLTRNCACFPRQIFIRRSDESAFGRR
jgi:hypothetical protein